MLGCFNCSGEGYREFSDSYQWWRKGEEFFQFLMEINREKIEIKKLDEIKKLKDKIVGQNILIMVRYGLCFLSILFIRIVNDLLILLLRFLLIKVFVFKVQSKRIFFEMVLIIKE